MPPEIIIVDANKRRAQESAAKTAAAAAAPPAPELVIPSADELANRTADLYESVWGEKPTKEVVESVVQSLPHTAAPAAQAPAAAPAPVPAEGEPQAEPTPPKPRRLSQEEVISRTATEVGRAVASELRQGGSLPASGSNRPAAGKPATPELSPEDRSDYEALLYLERTEPDEWAGMPAKFLEYVQNLAAYIEKWSSDNSDKEFDPNDTDHDDWYSQNQPQIERRALDQAKVDIRAEEKAEQKIAPVKKRLEEADQEKAFQKAIPTIAANMNRAIVTLMDQVNPELGKILKDPNGNPLLTKESIDALDNADPIAKAAADTIIKAEFEPLVLELEKTAVAEMNYRLEPERNAAHAAITRYTSQLERDFMALSPTERQWDGKNFMTISEMNLRANEIRNSPGTEQERQEKLQRLYDENWCVTVDQVAGRITEECADKIKRAIEAMEAPAKKKYGGKQAPAVPASQPPQPAPRATTPEPAPRPASRAPSVRPPPSLSTSDMVSTPQNQPQTEKTPSQQATDVMFSR